MKHVLRSTFVAVAVLLLLGIASSANAQGWDLATDWSDTNNPNGGWSYGILSSSLSSFTPFTQQTTNYLGIGLGWEVAAGPPVGMAQNTGSANALFDIPIGSIAGHTPVSSNYLAAQWTAPDSGSFDLDGNVWRPNSNNPGRVEMVSLFVNNTPLFQDILIPDPSATWNSGHPFTFEDAIVEAGGSANSLLNVALQAGDTVTLAARRYTTEDFVGMNFEVTPAAVPETNTVVMVILGLALPSVLFLQRRFWNSEVAQHRDGV